MAEQTSFTRLGLFVAIGYLCTGVVLNTMVSLPLFNNLFNQANYGLITLAVTVIGLLGGGQFIISKIYQRLEKTIKFSHICLLLAVGLIALTLPLNKITLFLGLACSLSAVSCLGKLHVLKQTPWLIHQPHCMWCFGVWLLSPTIVVLSFVSSPVPEVLASRLIFAHFLLINLWLFLLRKYGDELLNDDSEVYVNTYRSILHAADDADDDADDGTENKDAAKKYGNAAHAAANDAPTNPQNAKQKPQRSLLRRIFSRKRHPSAYHPTEATQSGSQTDSTLSNAPEGDSLNNADTLASGDRANHNPNQDMHELYAFDDGGTGLLSDISTLNSILNPSGNATLADADGSMHLTGINTNSENSLPSEPIPPQFASSSDSYPPLELHSSQEEAMTILGAQNSSGPDGRMSQYDKGLINIEPENPNNSGNGHFNAAGQAFSYTDLNQNIADMLSADVHYSQPNKAPSDLFSGNNGEKPDWFNDESVRNSGSLASNINLLPDNAPLAPDAHANSLQPDFTHTEKQSKQDFHAPNYVPEDDEWMRRTAIASGEIAGLSDLSQVTGLNTDNPFSILPPTAENLQPLAPFNTPLDGSSNSDSAKPQFSTNLGANRLAGSKQTFDAFNPNSSFSPHLESNPNRQHHDYTNLERHNNKSNSRQQNRMPDDAKHKPLQYDSAYQAHNKSSDVNPVRNQHPKAAFSQQSPNVPNGWNNKHNQQHPNAAQDAPKNQNYNYDSQFQQPAYQARKGVPNYGSNDGMEKRGVKYGDISRKPPQPKLEYSLWSAPQGNAKPLPKRARPQNSRHYNYHGAQGASKKPSFIYTNLDNQPASRPDVSEKNEGLAITPRARNYTQLQKADPREMNYTNLQASQQTDSTIGDVFNLDYAKKLQQDKGFLKPEQHNAGVPEFNIDFGETSANAPHFNLERNLSLPHSRYSPFGADYANSELKYTDLESTAPLEPLADEHIEHRSAPEPRKTYADVQRGTQKIRTPGGGIEIVSTTKKINKVDPEKIAKLREQVLHNPDLTPEQIETIKANTNIGGGIAPQKPMGIADYEAPEQKLEKVSLLGSRTSVDTSLLDPALKNKLALQQAKNKSQIQTVMPATLRAKTKQEEQDDEGLEQLLLQLRNRRRQQKNRRSIFINR